MTPEGGGDTADAIIRVEKGDRIGIESFDRCFPAMDGGRVFVDVVLEGALYRASATLAVKIFDPPPFVAALSDIGPFAEVQRRAWVRGRVRVPVIARYIDSTGGGRLPVEETKTIDISAGGARLERLRGVAGGETVRLTFSLDSGEFEVTGVVLEAAGRFTRLQFTNIGERAVKALNHEIFLSQLQVRRPG